jgi:Flp pilus assembly protein TadD
MSPAHPPRHRATAALLAALCTAVLTAWPVGATAADDYAPKANDPLAAVRAQIANQRWGAAIDELKRQNDTGSADWNNLMGYALRKNQPPDHAGAERHYDAALRINPQHRGALEYSGELYLLMGNLPRAEARLAALDKACTLPCEEYTDLKQAIARYKAKP